MEKTHNKKNQPYPTPMKLMKKCVDEIVLCDFRIKSNIRGKDKISSLNILLYYYYYYYYVIMHYASVIYLQKF
jgi:hypothetical protein